MTDFLTLGEAAERLGKSRRTVGRMLAAGELPGAVKGDAGWQIPADIIEVEPSVWKAPAGAEASTLGLVTAEELTAIRTELEDWRRRAEVAEAVADERADALRDTRAALALAQRLAAVSLADAVEVKPIEPAPTPRRWSLPRWRRG